MIIGHVIRRFAHGMIRGMVRHWFVTLLTLCLTGGIVYALAVQNGLQIPGLTPAPEVASSGPTATDPREMVVEEIRPIRNGEQINLVLKEKAGNRRLVMSIGQSEAVAIFVDLSALQQRAKPKIDPPTSYDLMRSMVKELGGTVNRVVVNNVSNETFYAKVIMSVESRLVEVDSRPSDAIALALRAHVPIFAEASVLDRAGVSGS